MPQELHILCCSSCKMYQVHIVKKAKKWQCKICNLKQFYTRVFFRGSGKDCRIQVQKLNAMKAYENDGNASFNADQDVGCSSYSYEHATHQSRSNVTENESTEHLNSSDEIEFNIPNASTNVTGSFKEDTSFEHSYIDNSEYECSQNDYIDKSSCYENEYKKSLFYDNKNEDDDTMVEEKYDNMSNNDSKSQNNFCSKDIKEAKNIFDDNEDLDFAIDF